MTIDIIATLPEHFVIYLARHATPDRTRTDILYYTVPGPELTERGLQEAAELGEFLQQAGVVEIYASPLERTWRTASIAGSVSGLVPVLNEDLHEWRPEETEAVVLARMQRIVKQAAERSRVVGPVALVTHGGPVHALLKAFGLSHTWIDRFRIYDSRNPVPPAGAWRVERVDGELNIRLVFAPEGVKIPLEAAPE